MRCPERSAASSQSKGTACSHRPVRFCKPRSRRRQHYSDFYRFLQIFTDFSDFLGRLQPSKTTIQKTPDSLGVEESTSTYLLLPTSTYLTLLYLTLLYSTLLYFTLLYSTLLDSTLLDSTLLYSTLLYSTLLYSTLLDFTLLGVGRSR